MYIYICMYGTIVEATTMNINNKDNIHIGFS